MKMLITSYKNNNFIKKIKHALFVSIVGAGIAQSALATLVLPPQEIGLNTPIGQAILAQAREKSHYPALQNGMQTEIHGTYCGIASSVMVLNALNIRNRGFSKKITQTNIFNRRVRQAINMKSLNKYGLSSPDVVNILQSYHLHAKFYKGNTTSFNIFLKTIMAALKNPKQEVIAHFSRPALGQVGQGHFSPIAAYDVKSNRFLIMDVASYKYQPFWVNAFDLWEAMIGFNKIRGFIVVSK